MKSLADENRCIHCYEPTLDGQDFCCRGCEIAYGAINSIFGDEEGSKQFYELARGELRSPTPRLNSESIEPLRESVKLVNNVSSAEWYLEGVHCRACVWLVDQMPRSVEGVVSARTDISSNLLRLEWDPERTSVEEIVQWLDPLGYTPHPTTTMDEGHGLVPVGASVLLAMNTMMVTVTSYGGLSPENDFEVWRFLSLAAGIMASVSMYLFRYRIYRLVSSIKLKKLPVDLPIVIGLVAAWVSSWFHLFQSSGELWFDAISVLVALLLATEWYTDRTRRRIGQFTQVDFSIVPEFTNLESGGIVRRDEVIAGDRLLAASNDVLITDGVALEDMLLDRSVQTGESLPLKVEKGGDVFAGDRSMSPVDSKVAYEARVKYRDSRLALLLQTLRSPDYLDSPVVDRAEKLSSIFVKIVLVMALVATAFSVAFVGEYGAVIALLIVACPCGLAIATPLSYAIGMGQIRRKGVLLKGASTIDILDQASDIIFDKTGTLTDGKFRMQSYDGDKRSLKIASALESFSTHPISTAFRKDVYDMKVENVECDRMGVSGNVDGVSYRVTRSRKKANEEGFAATGLFRVEDDVEIATFYTGDALRRESLSIVQGLKNDGLNVHILSGDLEENVAKVSNQLGVDSYRAGVTPEEKAEYIRELKGKGRAVLFLGDGTNDALACLEADASFVVKGASPVTFSRAEGLLDSRDLKTFYEAKKFAGKVRKRTQFALSWALVYNIIMLFACAFGFVTPLVAAIAMPLSSAILVLITTSGAQNFSGFVSSKPAPVLEAL